MYHDVRERECNFSRSGLNWGAVSMSRSRSRRRSSNSTKLLWDCTYTDINHVNTFATWSCANCNQWREKNRHARDTGTCKVVLYACHSRESPWKISKRTYSTRPQWNSDILHVIKWPNFKPGRKVHYPNLTAWTSQKQDLQITWVPNSHARQKKACYIFCLNEGVQCRMVRET